MFDHLNFSEAVALAYEQRNGYQPRPGFSCLTRWEGYKKGAANGGNN